MPSSAHLWTLSVLAEGNAEPCHGISRKVPTASFSFCALNYPSPPPELISNSVWSGRHENIDDCDMHMLLYRKIFISETKTSS